jgi:uncharacterized protein (DUF427 family)
LRPKPDQPGPGQESVWDYPRPPRLERTAKRIEIWCNGSKVVDTTDGWRVLETSHPPVYYIPRAAIDAAALTEAHGRSFCEWKGTARFVSLRVGDRVAERVGWYYPDPAPGFEPIRDHVAFYAHPMDRCAVDGQTVRPQPGRFYGGWITPDIVGPFKGAPGTEFW